MPDNSQELKNAKKYAFLLLKFRPRSINEFRGKLKRHGFQEEIIEELVNDFKNRGLLDDAKFAELWAFNRANLKSIGKIKLEAELEAKGLDKIDIEKGLSVLAREVDEYDSARALAEKRTSRLAGLDKITKKRRLFAFLQRHGFSSDVSVKVTKEMVG